MVLKQIITRNIQSHREVVIDLPPTGLIVFTGDNSNGKSIIIRVTEALLTNKIAKPRKRSSLVNRQAPFGTVTYVRSDGAVLEAHIQREAAGTYVKLSLPGEEPIIRYIADRSYRELVMRFGWHYSEEAGLSLNIAQEEDELLFYKTRPKEIRTLLESATTDSEANTVAESLDNLLSDTRKLKESYTQQQRAYMQTMQTITIEDIDPLQKKLDILERCNRNLSVVYFPNIPDIQAVPNVHYVQLYKPSIPAVHYPKIVSISCKLPDITAVAKELKILKEHRCPMCGRGFETDACEDPIHRGLA